MNARVSKFLRALCWVLETTMSSNLQCFSVAVNLEIGVDSLERYPQNITIPLKNSHLISNKRVQTESL